MKRSSTSKPGCKGDPRMNRAVQARLENPDMPLYHALRVGGFMFPANEDASTLDDDQVTLGQRKNQLLRRLRQLARKQEREENEQQQQQQQEQQAQSSQQQQQVMSEKAQQQPPQQQQQAAALSTNTTDTSVVGSSGDLGELYQHLQQQQQVQQQPSPSQQQQNQAPPHQPHQLPNQPPQQNPLQLQHASFQQEQQQHQIDDNQTAGTKRPAPPSILDMMFGSDVIQQGEGVKRIALQQALQQGSLLTMAQNQMETTQQMQQHQQAGQLPPSLSSLTMGNQIMLPTEVRTLYQLGMQGATQPPSIQQESSSSEQKPYAHPLHDVQLQHQQQQSLLATNFPASATQASSRDPPGTTQMGPQHAQQQQQQAAITHAAASQQQQQLQQQQDPYSAEAIQAKETMALRLFQQELQTLYCRSMLAAGYAPQDTTQRSPYFRRFAFNAWKQECERLQGILGDDQESSFLPNTTPTATTTTTTANTTDVASQQQQQQQQQPPADNRSASV